MRLTKPFGAWERPAFRLGDRVRETVNGREGEVYGFLTWDCPMLCYAVAFDEGQGDPETFTQLNLLLVRRGTTEGQPSAEPASIPESD